jgi:hypothetical protein
MRRISSLVTVSVFAALMVMLWSIPAFARSEPVVRHPPTCYSWTWDWFWSPGAHWWYWQYYRWCYEPIGGWFLNWGMWGWW